MHCWLPSAFIGQFRGTLVSGLTIYFWMSPLTLMVSSIVCLTARAFKMSEIEACFSPEL
jgi:hypothetical protein